MVQSVPLHIQKGYFDEQPDFFISKLELEDFDKPDKLGNEVGRIVFYNPKNPTQLWNDVTSVTISNGFQEITYEKGGYYEPALDFIETDNSSIAVSAYMPSRGAVLQFELGTTDEESTEIEERHPLRVVSLTANGKTYTNFNYHYDAAMF